MNCVTKIQKNIVFFVVCEVIIIDLRSGNSGPQFSACPEYEYLKFVIDCLRRMAESNSAIWSATRVPFITESAASKNSLKLGKNGGNLHDFDKVIFDNQIR
jgi:hypothetical protein